MKFLLKQIKTIDAKTIASIVLRYEFLTVIFEKSEPGARPASCIYPAD